MARIVKGNLGAFLDMIAYSEGTSTSKHTIDDGYDVIVDGINSPKVMHTYRDHPNYLVKVNAKGLNSTAAGRYQLLSRWWRAYKSSLGLKDFSPESQDAVAIQQIRERGAMKDIEEGRIETAIDKCRNIWASLPGAGYGQKEHKLSTLLKKYQDFGGKL